MLEQTVATDAVLGIPCFASMGTDPILITLEVVTVLNNCKVLSCIGQFPNDRIMKVNVRGRCTQWAQVISGVLQGSVWGPLLFIFVIAPLGCPYL